MILLSLFVLLAVGNTSASTSGRLHGRDIGRNKVTTRTSASTAGSRLSVIEMPRGGGTKDNLVTAFNVVFGTHGFVSLAAPEVCAEKMYGGGFDLSKDSVAQISMELVGSSLLGTAIMAYLSTQTMTPTSKIVVYGSLPCLYGGLRRFLKGSFEKFGYMKGYGSFANIAPIALGYALLTGKGNADLLSKIDIGVPLGIGTIGYLLPDLGLKFQGLTAQDGVTNAILGWWYTSLMVWGVLGMALVKGVNPYRAVGYACVTFAACLIDVNLLRKQNAPLKLATIQWAPVVVIFAMLSYGLLI